MLQRIFNLPCFKDIHHRSYLATPPNYTLDGLRGLAAVVVFIQHLTLPLLMLPFYLKYFSYSGLFAMCVIGSIVAWKWLPADIFNVGHRYWQEPDALLPFFIAIFLGGVSVAAMEYTPAGNAIKQRKIPHIFEDGVMFILLVCAVFCNLSLRTNLAHKPETWNGHLVWGWLLSAILAWVILRPNQTFSRFLRWRPLRAIGIISYSFYLLHIVVKRLLVKYGYTGWELFFFTGIITYLLSCATYCLIERPCMAFGRTKHIADHF